MPLTIALLCSGGALGLSLITEPVYQGSVKLLVVAKSDPRGGVSSAYEGALLSQQLVKSFAQILKSRATARAALRLDPQPYTPRQLQSRINAEPVTDTLLIDLTVDDTQPTRAKRLTNSVARAFIDTISTQNSSAFRISLVEPALKLTEPIRPRTRLNLMIGLTLGLLLGIGLAFLREFLDRSIKSKLTAYFASGRPIVAAVRSESEAAVEMRAAQAGVTRAPEDPAEMLGVLEGLADNPSLRERLGANCARYCQAHLNAPSVLPQWARLVESLAGRPDRHLVSSPPSASIDQGS